MILSVPEEELLPALVSCRLFDSRQEGLIPGKPTRPRVTECYEFSFYLTDSGTFTADGQSFPIRSGAIRFTPPGVTVNSVSPYRCYTVNFSLHPSGGRCADPFLDAIPLFTQTSVPAEYPPLLEELIAQSYESDTGSAIARRALLFRLLALVYRDSTTARGTLSAAETAVSQALAYLEEHLEEPLSLDALGELYGYHPVYFQRLFRQVTGKSPHEQLTYLRLRRARMLLATTALPVSAIAARCGYSSVSHFNTIFKKQSGLAPLSYRRRSRSLP